MPTRTLAILNPASRGGATGQLRATLATRLRAALGPLELEVTRGPGDAERLAREARLAGIDRLLVAGGDGTVSEVATGLMAAGRADAVELGLLPLGTGSDLARSLGIPAELDAAIGLLARGKIRPLDAGRVSYRDAAGELRTRIFANVASLGISGHVVQLARRAPRWLGGRGAFLIATLRALAAQRSHPVVLRLDGELLNDGPLVLAVAANGRYFGGGMHVAPRARPDDGCFDVVCVEAVSHLRLAFKLSKLYRGTHLDDPVVRAARGRVLEAEAEPGRVWIEADGEPLGRLPARFEILPGVLRVISGEV